MDKTTKIILNGYQELINDYNSFIIEVEDEMMYFSKLFGRQFNDKEIRKRIREVILGLEEQVKIAKGKIKVFRSVVKKLREENGLPKSNGTKQPSQRAG